MAGRDDMSLHQFIEEIFFKVLKSREAYLVKKMIVQSLYKSNRMNDCWTDKVLLYSKNSYRARKVIITILGISNLPREIASGKIYHPEILILKSS